MLTPELELLDELLEELLLDELELLELLELELLLELLDELDEEPELLLELSPPPIQAESMSDSAATVKVLAVGHPVRAPKMSLNMFQPCWKTSNKVGVKKCLNHRK